MNDPDHLRFYLGTGKAKATKQAVLARACGWLTGSGKPNTRRVRHALKSLRAEGIIVVSDENGTYIAESQDEIAAYKESIFAHIKGLMETVRAIDTAWEAEIADELFTACRNCGAVIPRDRHYCDADCRQDYHTRAREVGYSMLEGAA